VLGAVLDGVAHELDRWLDRKDPGAAADELFKMSFCAVPRNFLMS